MSSDSTGSINNPAHDSGAEQAARQAFAEESLKSRSLEVGVSEGYYQTLKRVVPELKNEEASHVAHETKQALGNRSVLRVAEVLPKVDSGTMISAIARSAGSADIASRVASAVHPGAPAGDATGGGSAATAGDVASGQAAVQHAADPAAVVRANPFQQFVNHSKQTWSDVLQAKASVGQYAEAGAEFVGGVAAAITLRQLALPLWRGSSAAELATAGLATVAKTPIAERGLVADMGVTRLNALPSLTAEIGNFDASATTLAPISDLPPEISSANLLPPEGTILTKVEKVGDTAPGMTKEEFLARHQTGSLTGERVRVNEKLEPTTGYMISQRNIANRLPGAVGTMQGYVPGHGGDVWWVTQENGVAPYTVETELGPEILKPSPVTDSSLAYRTFEGPISNLKEGDELLMDGREFPRGYLEGRKPWQGSATLKNLSSGQKTGVSGKLLYSREGYSQIVGSNANPTEVRPGDVVRFAEAPDYRLPAGDYKVEEISGMVHGDEFMFGQFKVNSLTDTEALLEQTKPLSGTEGIGDVYRVPLDRIRQSSFSRLEPLEVHPGDTLALPKGSSPNSWDWQFDTMRGRSWKVLQANDNVVALANGSDKYLMPKSYLKTPYVYKLDDWLTRINAK